MQPNGFCPAISYFMTSGGKTCQCRSDSTSSFLDSPVARVAESLGYMHSLAYLLGGEGGSSMGMDGSPYLYCGGCVSDTEFQRSK